MCGSRRWDTERARQHFRTWEADASLNSSTLPTLIVYDCTAVGAGVGAGSLAATRAGDKRRLPSEIARSHLNLRRDAIVVVVVVTVPVTVAVAVAVVVVVVVVVAAAVVVVVVVAAAVAFSYGLGMLGQPWPIHRQPDCSAHPSAPTGAQTGEY